MIFKRPVDVRISDFDVRWTFFGCAFLLSRTILRTSVVHHWDFCGYPTDIKTFVVVCPLNIRWRSVVQWVVMFHRDDSISFFSFLLKYFTFRYYYFSCCVALYVYRFSWRSLLLFHNPLHYTLFGATQG